MRVLDDHEHRRLTRHRLDDRKQRFQGSPPQELRTHRLGRIATLQRQRQQRGQQWRDFVLR